MGGKVVAFHHVKRERNREASLAKSATSQGYSQRQEPRLSKYTEIRHSEVR
ncbi:hypothetical protein AMTR_s00088p00098290 [Amborella trichopoda]|uniref:Uncharacterized protein n=1 Tax=Amborella trichopoda TaxID=13333 RepID=W1NW91_AMBTC|nr:hypothetical protein AMTR_s00088p00098290 [Amborella trichopoda]